MTPAIAWVAVGSFVLSFVITGAVRRLALKHGMIDVPNARSSHTEATPRGGGLAIFVSATLGIAALYCIGAISKDVALAVCGSGGAVAIAGLIDDRRGLRPGVRLLVHFIAAGWAVGWLGGLPTVSIGGVALQLGWLGDLLAVAAIVWTLNLFNFMDGIDGIAASEAVFIGISAWWLSLRDTASAGIGSGLLAFVGACAGFLPWNWPTAKIFMGDVGSGYLGCALAVLALAAMREDPGALWVWLILGGVFFIDSTVTLVRRAIRGARIYEAHRSHAYQWLARRWSSHLPVTLTVLGIDLFWLLPWAKLASVAPRYSLAVLGIALVPLVAAALVAGAGRAERPDQ